MNTHTELTGGPAYPDCRPPPGRSVTDSHVPSPTALRKSESTHAGAVTVHPHSAESINAVVTVAIKERSPRSYHVSADTIRSTWIKADPLGSGCMLPSAQLSNSVHKVRTHTHSQQASKASLHNQRARFQFTHSAGSIERPLRYTCATITLLPNGTPDGMSSRALPNGTPDGMSSRARSGPWGNRGTSS